MLINFRAFFKFIFMKTLQAVLLSFCASGFLQAEASAFNAASFNLRNAPSENSNSWQIRAPAARALIRFHDFDIFGVQEAYFHQIKTLAGPEYAYIGVGRDDGKTAGEHSAILYKKSLFKCLESGDFWFSPTPEKPSLGWGARYKRICSWGKFKHLDSGKVFFVFNLHLDHESAEAQKNSVEMLVKNVKKIAGKAPYIIMGDFNLPTQNAAMQKLFELKGLAEVSDFKDFYGPKFSYHAYMQRQNIASQNDLHCHIDHIFYSSKDFSVQKAGLLTDTIPDFPSSMKNPCDNFSESGGRVGYPSDHFPLFARLKL